MTTFPVPPNYGDHVLVATPSSVVRQRVLESLDPRAYRVEHASGGAEALLHLEKGPWHKLFLDRRLPDLDAEELGETVRQHYPGLEVVWVDDENDTVVESELPADSSDNEKIDGGERLYYETQTQCSTLDDANAEVALPGMIGRSALMQAVYRQVQLVAPRDTTVLITGPTGSGKELVARALHDLSPRAARNFAVVNCAAIPETLLEAELFGYSRGAFTGALQAYAGRIQAAHLGTLFLDEIGDMSMPLQTRLLRVLAEGEFYRVGGQTPVRVDVRVIAATHQNLQDRVQSGLFREDLYHRLNVIRIELPPLRARAEDIPALLSHYMLVAARELGVEPKMLAAEAQARLCAHGWPGNVRELVNLCRRLSVLAPGSEVRLEDLPPELGAASGGQNEADWSKALASWADRHVATVGHPLLDEAQPEFERVLIRSALRRTQGHRQEAAKLIGWGRNTLTRKLKELGMDATD
jgi:two-component system, NtrC family, nitrogen regulation response regulator GlnG